MKSRYITIIVVLLVISTASVGFVNKLSIGDFVEVDTIEVYGEDLLLGANCKGIVGKISAERGHYIQLGKDDKLDQRPNVYDVFRDTLEQFDIEIESVKITKIEDNAFHSVMILSSQDKILKADARPSDAIALALRTGSKIYMNTTLLEEIGLDICSN